MGQGDLGQAAGTVAGDHALRLLGRNNSARVGSRNKSIFLKRFLDVLTEDARWYAWSSAALEQCPNEGPLCINPIIYTEVSIGVATIPRLLHRRPRAGGRLAAAYAG